VIQGGRGIRTAVRQPNQHFKLTARKVFTRLFTQRALDAPQGIGHATLKIQIAVIDGAALHRDRQGPRCYTAAGKARHALSHRDSPAKNDVNCNSSDPG